MKYNIQVSRSRQPQRELGVYVNGKQHTYVLMAGEAMSAFFECKTGDEIILKLREGERFQQQSFVAGELAPLSAAFLIQEIR